ncbi:MAG TPA: immunoglobulin-like domain-containing protein, partial [Chondromyces sp.]|nr:immunoglobulin-like domain-containing protein [Chondromyces sp.]
ITIETEKKQYTVNDTQITVHYQNHSDIEVSYGLHYSFEKNVNGTWYYVPFKEERGVPDITYTLHPDETKSETYPFNSLKEKLSPGEYRIIKNFGAISVAVPFKVIKKDPQNKEKSDQEDSMEVAKKQNKLQEDLNTELKKVGIEFDFIRVVGSMYFEEDQLVIKLKEKTDKRNMERLKNIRKIVEEKVKENSDGYRLEPAEYSYWELKNTMDRLLGSPITLSKNTEVSLNTRQDRVDIMTDKLSENDRNYISKNFGSSVKIAIDPDYEPTIIYAQ